jgi:hypothetical protein
VERGVSSAHDQNIAVHFAESTSEQQWDLWEMDQTAIKTYSKLMRNYY